MPGSIVSSTQQFIDELEETEEVEVEETQEVEVEVIEVEVIEVEEEESLSYPESV